MTGHFTAEIWKSVTSVGFGYAWGNYPYKMGDQTLEVPSIYVTANFYPTPNVQGQYTNMVPRPL